MNKSIGCCLAIFSVILTGCSKTETADDKPPVPVKVQRAALQSENQPLIFAGQIISDRQVDVAFKQTGYIKTIARVRDADGTYRDIQEGDFVQKGTVLASIRPEELRSGLTRSVEQRASAGAALASSQAQIARALANQKLAAENLGRAQALYAAQALTRPDYDEAVANFDSARAQTKSARDDSDSRAKELGAAGAASRIAGIALQESCITAPVSGTVITKSIEPGSFVTTGTVAFTLAEVDTVKFSFGVPDSVVVPLTFGAPVKVKIDAFPLQSFKGTVSKISTGANQDARTYQIEVKLPNLEHKLKVGMIASAILDSENTLDSVSVPLNALRSTQSGSDGFNIYCIEKREGKTFAKLKFVRTRKTSGNYALLKSGLNAGEEVISNPANDLDDGMQVSVVAEEAGKLE